MARNLRVDVRRASKVPSYRYSIIVTYIPRMFRLAGCKEDVVLSFSAVLLQCCPERGYLRLRAQGQI